MITNRISDVQKQEAEIAAWKEANPDKWKELPQGYSMIDYKGYSYMAGRIMHLLETTGHAGQMQVGCNSKLWGDAVAEIKRKVKRKKIVKWVKDGVVVGIKVKGYEA